MYNQFIQTLLNVECLNKTRRHDDDDEEEEEEDEAAGRIGVGHWALRI
jgi:hypothetical protein